MASRYKVFSKKDWLVYAKSFTDQNRPEIFESMKFWTTQDFQYHFGFIGRCELSNSLLYRISDIKKTDKRVARRITAK